MLVCHARNQVARNIRLRAALGRLSRGGLLDIGGRGLSVCEGGVVGRLCGRHIPAKSVLGLWGMVERPNVQQWRARWSVQSRLKYIVSSSCATANKGLARCGGQRRPRDNCGGEVITGEKEGHVLVTRPYIYPARENSR